MEIRLDDLTGPEIHALLEEHLKEMRRISPPEGVVWWPGRCSSTSLPKPAGAAMRG